jgi:NodT family efflux transporter outer membrane factor (OMF) lipoprotein
LVVGPKARLGAASCAAAALVLTGCSFTPAFERPPLPTPGTYGGEPAGPGSVARVGWRDFFQEAELRSLIAAALANNRDVRIAAARVEEARAAFRVQGSALYPQLDGVATGTRSRTPADLSITGRAETTEQFSSLLSAGWELDFWGRLRSLRRSALEQYLATEEARRAVATSLIAQVAFGYLLEGEYEERMALARATVDTRREALRIMRRRYEVGAGSKLEMTQAQTLLGQARTAVEALARDQEVNRNALALLVGRPVEIAPGSLRQAEAGGAPALPAGLPSELLVNRPDIAAAEHRLRSANADIGAARAAFFPSIILTGAYGAASADLVARDLRRGGQVALGVWIDGAMPQRAETVQGYLQALHGQWLSDMARQETGIRPASGLVNIETRYRYNPDVRSLVAIGPAVIPLLLMLFPAILTALSVVREKELGSIVNFYVTPARPLEFLLGKQLPYVALAMANYVLLLLVALLVFRTPITGNVLAMTLGAVFYVMSATAIGLLFSIFMRSQIAAMFATAIGTILPAVQFSGLINPVSSLEGAGALVGRIFPTAPFVTICRGVFSKRLGFADLQAELLLLAVTAPVLLIACSLLLRKQER